MKYKAGFIGAGNMGGALLRAVVNAAGKDNVVFYDPDSSKADETQKETGATFDFSESVCLESKFVFIGVKPNIIGRVLDSLSKSFSDDTVIVSMAAGTSISEIESHVGNTKKIIRIMPNTPASVGAGMILYAANSNVTEGDEIEFLEIMKKTGVIDKLDEKLIDAAAALSGCGPAFVYMFIEALADGAVACGLPREKAMLYAKQTVLGASKLAIDSDKHPGALKDSVCSPGGTTIEGVLALEDGAFRGTCASAVVAAYEKTKRLK